MAGQAIDSETPLRTLDEVDYLAGVDDATRQGALRLSVPGIDEWLAKSSNIPRSWSSSASSTHQTESARESKARSRSRRCSTPVQAHSAERGLIRHQHQPGYLTSEGDEHLRRNGRARSRGACRTCRRLRALERGCLPRGRWHTVRHLTVEECRSEERLQANRGPAHGKGFGAGANEVGSSIQTLEESAIFQRRHQSNQPADTLSPGHRL